MSPSNTNNNHQQQQQQRSIRSQKSSIFPQKLWRMVNDRQLDSAIKWNYDGRSFLLCENTLKNLCLGKENKLFYTNQPKSFVRQLHLYGFRKISKNQFSHQFFVRDRPELLRNIRRSYKQQSASTSSIRSDKSDASSSGNQTNENSLASLPMNGQQREKTRQQQQQQQQQHTEVDAEGNNKFNIDFHQIDCQQSINSNQIGYQQLLPCSTTASEGALAFANNYDAPYASPASWFETNYADDIINYNEENALISLYNDDLYPGTFDPPVM